MGSKGYQTDFGYLNRSHPPIQREAADYTANLQPKH